MQSNCRKKFESRDDSSRIVILADIEAKGSVQRNSAPHAELMEERNGIGSDSNGRCTRNCGDRVEKWYRVRFRRPMHQKLWRRFSGNFSLDFLPLGALS